MSKGLACTGAGGAGGAGRLEHVREEGDAAADGAPAQGRQALVPDKLSGFAK